MPQYVAINSIDELAANKDRFSSEIVGIDAGAGIMKTTDKAISTYGLDGYTLMTSSSSTMLASLKKRWIGENGLSLQVGHRIGCSISLT